MMKRLTGSVENAVLLWAGKASETERKAFFRVTEHRQGTAFSARIQCLTQVRHVLQSTAPGFDEAARGVGCTVRMHAEREEQRIYPARQAEHWQRAHLPSMDAVPGTSM